MRFLVVVALAGLFAAAAHATARPISPQDRSLLARPATSEERVAEHVAERLTRHASISVRCGPLGEASNILGLTPIRNGRPLDYFLMRPEECTYLAWFHQTPARWDPRSCSRADCAYVGQMTWALQTVAHESYHLLGYSNEAQVDCYGMQSIWFVASSLGASVSEAQAFAQLFATRIYPLRRADTPLYWSPECRDGGRYDLRPASHAWPS